MGAEGPFDAVVVGGGVIGLSVAWKVAAAGARVAVVDPTPGRGASWAAAGMLAPVGEAVFGEEDQVGLHLLAAGRWPAFAAELEVASGQPVGYARSGTVLAAADASDRRVVDDLLRLQLGLGLDARRLTAGQCRTLEPLLAPGIHGGAEFAADHRVDNRRVVTALLAACHRSGVTAVADRATAVTTAGGRVTGVALADGAGVSAPWVVVAAGCHSGRLGGLPADSVPPVRPVKGMTVRLTVPGSAPVLARTVRGVVNGRSCYLVPRDDRTVVLGATVEERGFDLSVQAGAVHALLDDARTLVPAVDEYVVDELSTGSRPGTPDNAPVVGPTGPDGLVVATGHYRNGILLAPATAEAVAAVLAGGALDPALAPWAPGRFATGTAPAPRVPA